LNSDHANQQRKSSAAGAAGVAHELTNCTGKGKAVGGVAIKRGKKKRGKPAHDKKPHAASGKMWFQVQKGEQNLKGPHSRKKGGDFARGNRRKTQKKNCSY